MNNFVFHNPTRIVFGKGTIARLSEFIPQGARVLLLSGKGSMHKNGVYEQVISAIGDKIVVEYEGILPNPTHEQCSSVQKKIEGVGVNFILAVGGGSVIDAAKYIAVGSQLPPSESCWDFIEKRVPISKALPVGVILTAPASGSEMNSNAVILNVEKKSKRSLKSEKVFPSFSILDPEVTKTLSPRQIRNGIIDSYSHVIEQYLTFPSDSRIQDRFSESILSTLLEIGPLLIANPYDYDLMANFMWASTCALNGFICCGVPQDWSTHMIGHELTAEYGLVHAESIGIVLPGVMNYMKQEKREKLIQYGRRVFGLGEMTDDEIVQEAIDKTEEFFVSLGQSVRFSDFGLTEEVADNISKKIGSYPVKIGERKNIGEKEVREILLMRV
jgi:NADP-dependent alcohol dehydrogenase